jgi:hypothetical protein
MSGREFDQFALLETRQEAGATVGVPSDIFGIEFADLIMVSRPRTSRRQYVPLLTLPSQRYHCKQGNVHGGAQHQCGP